MDLRKRAVLTLLKNGWYTSEVSRLFGISKSTLYSWKRKEAELQRKKEIRDSYNDGIIAIFKALHSGGTCRREDTE